MFKKLGELILRKSLTHTLKSQLKPAVVSATVTTPQEEEPMAFNWTEAGEFVMLALSETAQLAPVIGGPDHLAAAAAVLNAASSTAQSVITDPTELAEAKGAFTAASAILQLFSLFKTKKTATAMATAPPVAG